jgi:mannose-6-phosphate isomerase
MRSKYLEKIWGGSRIAALPGKQANPPTGSHVGESWEVADLAEGTSWVEGGPLNGQSLSSLAKERGKELFGSAHVNGRFPLLVKLVDADADLSVQVHPDATYASTHAGTFSKDEAWLVVHANDGARILHGVKDGVGAAEFQRGIEENRADKLLRNTVVHAGDVVHVPPGTIHAIGPGLLILEVQEPSDTTFRVYDYGRLENGKPRALHVKQAMEVANFGAQPPVKQAHHTVFAGAGVKHETLVSSRAYTMQRVHLDGGAHFSLDFPANAPAVLFTLGGTLSVDEHMLPRGGTLVVPACVPGVKLAAREHAATAIVMLPSSMA